MLVCVCVCEKERERERERERESTEVKCLLTRPSKTAKFFNPLATIRSQWYTIVRRPWKTCVYIAH